MSKNNISSGIVTSGIGQCMKTNNNADGVPDAPQFIAGWRGRGLSKIYIGINRYVKQVWEMNEESTQEDEIHFETFGHIHVFARR